MGCYVQGSLPYSGLHFLNLPETIQAGDQIEGQWKQVKGKMKEKWGRLTDDDWDQVAGKRDQFIGKLQERYGYTREQAEKDFEDWQRTSSKVA